MQDLYPDRIGIWKFWFFRRVENQNTQEKPLEVPPEQGKN